MAVIAHKLQAVRRTMAGGALNSPAKSIAPAQKIKAVARAIADGADVREMREKMKHLDSERNTLEADMTALEKPEVIEIHPHAASLYSARICDLRKVLSDDESKAEATALLRSVVAEIKLTPTTEIKMSKSP